MHLHPGKAEIGILIGLAILVLAFVIFLLAAQFHQGPATIQPASFVLGHILKE